MAEEFVAVLNIKFNFVNFIFDLSVYVLGKCNGFSVELKDVRLKQALFSLLPTHS